MKSFTFKLAISFALMSFAYGQTPFLPCADGSPAPIFVDKNCTSPVCNYTSGTYSLTKFQFTSPSQISSMDLRVMFVTTADMTQVVNYETVDDACELLNDVKCPLEEGETVTMTQPILVPSYGVPVLGLAEYRLFDPNGSLICCFNYPVSVVEPTAQ